MESRLSVSRLHCLFREFTFYSWFHYEFTICSANKLKIHYEFANSLSVSRIHYLFRELTVCFANSSWIIYPLHQITMNSLSASRFYYEYTICFANWLWNHYLLRDFCLNLLARIYYLFRELTLNLLFFCQITLNSLYASN